MARPYNILFLCTGNSARSILAEALANRMGEGRLRAHSAGSDPKGQVHPAALELLERSGLSTERLRSKSWDEFGGPAAPQIDFIITVCDNAAGAVCPIWPGKPMTAHWSIEDPAAVEGPGQREAFAMALQRLEALTAAFLALSIDGANPADLQSRLRELSGVADADRG